MKVVERWYSQRVEREVTLARWGHFGTPVLVFPTAGGDAEEIERMHLVGACGELLDAGRIKIYSCDSIAGKAMVEDEGDFLFRTKLLNQFQQMIAEEIVPAIHADCGGQQLPMVAAGASIGAFNALAAQCRYPWTFRTSICMSGSYRLQRFLGGDYSPDLYLSSPLDYLPGLEGPVLEPAPSWVRVAHFRGGRLGSDRRVVGGGEHTGRQGYPEPRRLLGHGLGTRLGHLAGHAAGLPARVHLTHFR